MCRLLLSSFLLVLWSCDRPQEWYAPPPQRQPIRNPHPYNVTYLVDFGSPEADAHILRDIHKYDGSAWRWTDQHPAVRVKIRTIESRKYVIDYTVPDITFKDTGPVTISFYVNDHLLGSERSDKPGMRHFEKPVPPGWLILDDTNTLGAGIDKMWVARGDGKLFGFIISRIGLTQ